MIFRQISEQIQPKIFPRLKRIIPQNFSSIGSYVSVKLGNNKTFSGQDFLFSKKKCQNNKMSIWILPWLLIIQSIHPSKYTFILPLAIWEYHINILIDIGYREYAWDLKWNIYHVHRIYKNYCSLWRVYYYILSCMIYVSFQISCKHPLSYFLTV